MRSQLKAAIAVQIIVLIIAFAFSIAYFALGMFNTSRVLDVLLVAVWVLIAALQLVIFRVRSLQREEMVRRFYLSPNWVYNHEIGYAPVAQVVPSRDPYEFVIFAADALAKMSYGFDLAEAPEDFQPAHVILSREFDFHLIGDEEDPADKSVVIDTWKGTLQRVDQGEKGAHTFTDIGEFSNAKELAKLLDESDSFVGA